MVKHRGVSAAGERAEVVKGARKPRAAATEQPEGGAHVARERQYLLLDDVVELLHFDRTAPLHARESCRKWLERQAVPVLRRGRVLLIERAVLAAKLGVGA